MEELKELKDAPGDQKPVTWAAFLDPMPGPNVGVISTTLRARSTHTHAAVALPTRPSLTWPSPTYYRPAFARNSP